MKLDICRSTNLKEMHEPFNRKTEVIKSNSVQTENKIRFDLSSRNNIRRWETTDDHGAYEMWDIQPIHTQAYLQSDVLKTTDF